jgi:VCBS repeat-containing protein
VADIDSVAAGTQGPATGNVLTGGTDAIDPNTTDGVADVQGADGAVVVSGVAGNINANLDNPATLAAPIQGAFGKLTLAADGSYSYTRDAGTAGGANDVFTYTIKDGDGDLSHTTLTISIGNSPPTITNLTPAAGGGDVTVNDNTGLFVTFVGVDGVKKWITACCGANLCCCDTFTSTATETVTTSDESFTVLLSRNVLVKAGKIKAYAVTSKTKAAAMPNLPTVTESGLPGFEVSIWYGLFAPKGTHKPVIDKLAAALQEALRRASPRARRFAGTSCPWGGAG